MTTLLSYLLTFFAIMYWAFRVVVAVCFQLDIDFFATPLNFNYEIMVLFITLPCIVLVIKRNIVGAVIYWGVYITYFGTALYEAFLAAGETGFSIVNTSNIFCIFLGVVIPTLTFFDVLVNKHRTLGNGVNPQEWFYKNEKYDRDLDERVDRNQYKIH